MSIPAYYLTRAKAVNDTWAPRCDRYYFISDPSSKNLTREQMKIAKELPIAPIKNITSGYDHLTSKSAQAFLFAYEHHVHNFDWFVKADDDTYLIVDHLKAFLREQNSSEPITFGFNFKVICIF
jgi:glycoprotein-N-acetylgalactosamine 3-beta-galactosyltransferase